MIGQPDGWTRHTSGSRIVLVPPGGAECGAIRYDERRAPLAPLSVLFAEHTAGIPIEDAGTWERFVTIEGEYGAAITVRGLRDGDVVQRDLAIVVLDDAYALVAGYCLRADHFELFSSTVRELARGDTHVLGVRRRRFSYAAPRGWQARARGFAAEWYPPEFPVDRATLTVWPALPCRTVSAEALVDQAARDRPGRREPVVLHALSGIAFVAEGRRVIALQDDRYTYAMQLEAPHGAHEDALLACVRSIDPLPAPARAHAAALAAHWVE